LAEQVALAHQDAGDAVLPDQGRTLSHGDGISWLHRWQMQPIRVGLASRAALQRQQSNLDQAPQQDGKPASGEAFGGDVIKAALAHVLAGEHDGQQAGGVAW